MEKESVKDVFLRYGVLLGKRNTERQKTDFLRAAQKQLEQAGFPVGYHLCIRFAHEAGVCKYV